VVVTVKGSISLEADSPAAAAALVQDPAAKTAIQDQVATVAGVDPSRVSVNLTLAGRRLEVRQLQHSQNIIATYIISYPAASVQQASSQVASLNHTLSTLNATAFTEAVVSKIPTDYGVAVTAVTVSSAGYVVAPVATGTSAGTSAAPDFRSSSRAMPTGQTAAFLLTLLLAVGAARSESGF